MKKQKFILLLLMCLFMKFSFSQTTQASDSSSGVYPLQVGNLWQYWTYDYLNGQTTLIYGWTEKVISDTIISGGQKYYTINSDQPLSKPVYRKQDLNKVYQWKNGKDSLIYDFSKNRGDTIRIQPVGVNDTLFQVIKDDGYSILFSTNRKYWTYYTYFAKITYYEQKDFYDEIGIGYLIIEGGEEWFLRGAIINGITYGTITSVNDDKSESTPTDFILFPNYPNPFNAGTTISFNINSTLTINLAIYDLLGRKINTLINQEISSGTHRLFWNGKNENGDELSSGIYICRLQSSSYSFQRKMLMLK